MDLLKSFEFTSYNLLFDLCSYIKAHADFTSLDEVSGGIPQLLEQWCSQINSYAKRGEINSPVVHFDSVRVEEYSGQQVDSHQMRFAGETGNEKWLVTGNIYVEFWGERILFRANHTIRLAI